MANFGKTDHSYYFSFGEFLSLIFFNEKKMDKMFRVQAKKSWFLDVSSISVHPSVRMYVRMSVSISVKLPKTTILALKTVLVIH